MSIYSQENKNFFSWTPPSQPGYVTASFGIYKEVHDEHPLIFIYYEATKTYTDLVLDTHYTITNIKFGVDEVYSFDINYTQEAIDDFSDAGILCVYRNTELSQTSKFQEGDNLPVATIGDALDKLTMISQDNKSLMDLSLRVPFVDMYDTNLNPTKLKELPIIEDRKNKYLYFDSDGQPTAINVIDIETVVFSDWGEDLVAKQDSQEARTYIDCAKSNGDGTLPFNVGEPTESSHAVTLDYIQNLSVQTTNISQNNLLENSQFYISQRGFIDNQTEIFNENKFFFDRWQSLYGTDAVIETGASLNTPDTILYSKPYRSQYFVVNSPSTVVPAGDILGVQHSIEDRALHSVISSSVTFGCWIKIEGFTLSGPDALCIAILNEDETYSYIHEYTAVTNEWTYITFQVDLSTLNISTFNGSAALKIILTLDSGTDFNNGTNGQWINSKEYCTSNQISFSTISGAKFSYCNPVLVQSGNDLPINGTANLYRNYNDEYNRCKRFLQLLRQNQLTFNIFFPVTCNPEMASKPILTTTDPTGVFDMVLFKGNSVPDDNYDVVVKNSDNYFLNSMGGCMQLLYITGTWPEEPFICNTDTPRKAFLTCEI